jgi:hypothetical protein
MLTHIEQSTVSIAKHVIVMFPNAPIQNLGVTLNSKKHKVPMVLVRSRPKPGQYSFKNGIYTFSSKDADTKKKITITNLVIYGQ